MHYSTQNGNIKRRCRVKHTLHFYMANCTHNNASIGTDTHSSVAIRAMQVESEP